MTRAIQRKMVPARVTKILQHHQGKRRRTLDEGEQQESASCGAEKETVVHDELTSSPGKR
jgi:hypothetical protein